MAFDHTVPQVLVLLRMRSAICVKRVRVVLASFLFFWFFPRQKKRERQRKLCYRWFGGQLYVRDSKTDGFAFCTPDCFKT